MSADRLADLLVHVRDELRADSNLVSRLGTSDQIYVGTTEDPGSDSVALLLAGNYGTGDHRGRGERLEFVLQASVVAQASWVDSNSLLEMYRISDDAAAVLGTSTSPGLVPLGTVGETPIEIDFQDDANGQRYVLPVRWRYQRTVQTHDK